MATAFVTGVSGQDGHYLARALLGAGYAVHGLIRSRPAPPGVVGHRGDLADPEQVADLVLRLRPDLLVNLGGISSVARSWREPDLTRVVCADAVDHLLSAVERLTADGVPVRFLQPGSAEMFGDADHSPQTERTPFAPRSPYAQAKVRAHERTLLARSRGVFAATVILYNHESPLRGAGFVSRHIVTGAVAVARGRADELALGNLRAARDWGWAPDHVDAMVRVLHHERPDDFVVSTGEAHTVGQFALAALERAGVPTGRSVIRVDPARVRQHDVVTQVGDASRIGEVLGWRPTKRFDAVVAALVDAELQRTA